jgi:hypothetical protein
MRRLAFEVAASKFDGACNADERCQEIVEQDAFQCMPSSRTSLLHLAEVFTSLANRDGIVDGQDLPGNSPRRGGDAAQVTSLGCVNAPGYLGNNTHWQNHNLMVTTWVFESETLTL